MCGATPDQAFQEKYIGAEMRPGEIGMGKSGEAKLREPPTARPLPDVYTQRYGSVQAGRRGGVPSALRVAPLAAQ